MVERVDLHAHTTASDGSLSPTELVDLGVLKGLTLLAITDHDTMAGVGEACLRGAQTALAVLPGVEMGAQWTAEMHVLGLGVDPKDNVLNKALEKLRAGRIERNREIVQGLVKLGLPISWEAVSKGREGTVIGRGHIARALLENGAVQSIQEAFARYIGQGKPAYVPRFRYTPMRTLELICKAGGYPVLAHPVQLGLELRTLYALCGSLKESGLWGIEVFHPTQTPEQSEQYLRLARRLGLMVTGGSDFHGRNKPDVELGDAVVTCGELEASCRILKRKTCLPVPETDGTNKIIH